MRLLLRQLSVFVALCALGEMAHAQSCGPGQAGNCDAAAPPPPIIKPAPRSSEVTCRVPGRWIDSFDGVAIVNADLNGTMKFPYCNSTHAIAITLQGDTGFHVTGTWSGGSECISFTEDLTFVTCNQATGTFLNADGVSGNDTWVRDSNIKLAVEAAAPIIPSVSRVLNRRVLTRSNLTLTVTDTGQPVEGTEVTLQSSRGADDTINGPSATTDAAGRTTAQVQTRVQSGTSTITSADSAMTTDPAGTITWLPARYESQFLVTCYVVSLEADFTRTPQVGHVPGLPPENRYHRGFVNDVRLQGSGQALDGTYIHYDGRGRYSLQNCALTATGVCAVDGVTAAVDPNVIPLRSTISIDTVGARTAQDTGGAIDDYHIDEYFGTRRAACLAAGHRTLGVQFNNY